MDKRLVEFGLTGDFDNDYARRGQETMELYRRAGVVLPFITKDMIEGIKNGCVPPAMQLSCILPSLWVDRSKCKAPALAMIFDKAPCEEGRKVDPTLLTMHQEHLMQMVSAVIHFLALVGAPGAKRLSKEINGMSRVHRWWIPSSFIPDFENMDGPWREGKP